MRKPVLFLVLSMAMTPCLARMMNDTDPESLLCRHVERHAGGVVAAIVENGERTLHACNADTDALFELGSITKVFTAGLLADMVRQGELRLDDTLGDLLPGRAIPDLIAGITLQELAQHTSGLPRLNMNASFWRRVLLQGDDPYAGTTVESLWRDLETARAGERGEFAYSNLGSAVLGQVLAVHAGRPYAELLRERLLEPVGFDELFPDISLAPGERVMEGHGSNGLRTSHWHLDAYAPAGSMLGTAGALADYVVRQQHDPDAAWQFRQGGDNEAVRLGWMQSRIGEQTVIWHNGGTGGFRSFAGFLPDEDRAVVVLSSSAVDVDYLALRLLGVETRLESPPRPWFWTGLTALMMLLPPLGLLALWRKARRGDENAVHDRWEFLSLLSGYAFIYAIFIPFGAWQMLPLAVAWLSMAVTTALAIALWPEFRLAPWQGKRARWRTSASVFATVFYVGVTALLLV